MAINKQLLVLFSIISLSQAELCRDHSNVPISHCNHCLWRTDCEWCQDEGFDGIAVGCFKKGTSGCKQAVITSAHPKPMIVKDDPFVNDRAPFVQLSPQEAEIELLPNVEKPVEFRVLLADSPVDIYFIMDLSGSMAKLKDSLVSASFKISGEIGQLTSDYRVGFGSYSDKLVSPFSSDASFYEKRDLTFPHAFQHRMSLTKDVSRFQSAVANSSMANNVDTPESGLDAVAQAMLCSELVGWRGRGIRKVIIVMTDQEMHYAFDGILGGITRKFDMKCHTDPVTFLYTEETTLDYPSFGQIRRLIEETETSVVFLVKSYMKTWYEEFSRFIQGSENVAALLDNQNDEGLTEIITKQYESIRNRIAVRPIIRSDQIHAKTSSNCKNPDAKNYLVCNGVGVKEEITFTASISVTEEFCAENSQSQVTFQLGGFEQDRLNVGVRCERCNCGRRVVQNAPQCMNRGSLVCGGCECNDGFVGRNCECDLTSSFGGLEGLNAQCVASNQSEVVCSGYGHCFCGLCVCDSKHVGPFCSCDKEKCPKGPNGEMCNGMGDCNLCSVDQKPGCTCNSGWGGTDCTCDLSDDKCRDAVTNGVCFGRGRCQCGQCVCNRGYEGKYCQKSLAVPICAQLEPCITSKVLIANMSASDHETAYNLCKKNTEYNGKKLFGKELNIACRLDINNGSRFDDDYGEFALQIGYSNDMDCKSILEELESKANSAPGGVNFGESSREGGDITPSTALKRSTDGLEYCSFVYEGCEIVFYHSNLGSDDFFDPNQKVRPEDTVYIIHRPIYEEEDSNAILNWAPQIRCYEVPVAELMGASGGLLLAVIFIATVAAIVMINLRDLRAWQKYVALRQANEANLGNFENPLYESATTTFENPQCHIAQKK